MRNIKASDITQAVKQLCISTNCILNEDISAALKTSALCEQCESGRDILNTLVENANIAAEKCVPICQDTGMVLIFADIGWDAHIDGDISEAINEGVRQGYTEGHLRLSVVKDPIRRGNTGDNTPAVIYYDMVEGDKITLSVMPKGFGSENMGGIKMLKPSEGVQGVIDFVVYTVEKAGPNPCPPIVVGVGIGGTMDKAAVLSKKALLRSINERNPDTYYAELETLLLAKINRTGIGPQGFGGTTTALGVNIETFPTHIAGIPVGVTISCHVTRQGTAAL